MKNLVLISIFTIVAFKCYAQDSVNTRNIVFRCYLKDAASKKPVAFAHIYNESRKFGFISDTSGYFATNVRLNDTLVFMALGYLGKSYVISNIDIDTTTILLTTRSYEIGEVSVSLPRTYKEFRKAFMEVDVDKDKPMPELPKHNPYKTPVLLDTNVINSTAFAIFHPVSALYYKHSKVEKSKRKVWHLKQQELKQGEVDAKYNRNIVMDITGFEDHDLLNFMGWCNFDFNYLYGLTPLEIRNLIDNKHKEYLKCCHNSKESIEKD